MLDKKCLNSVIKGILVLYLGLVVIGRTGIGSHWHKDNGYTHELDEGPEE